MYTAVAVGIAILALGGFIWYKIKHSAEVESSAELKNAEIDRQAAQVETLQKQVAEQTEQERAQTHETVDQVLAIKDDAARRRAALDLLAKLRGVH